MQVILIEPLVHDLGLVHLLPEVLDRYLSPMWWTGLGVVGVAVVAAAWGAAAHVGGILQRAVRRIAAIYLGASLGVLSVISCNVYCLMIEGGGVTPEHLDKTRGYMGVWLCEIVFLWGSGLALIGLVALVRSLIPWRAAGPPAGRNSDDGG